MPDTPEPEAEPAFRVQMPGGHWITREPHGDGVIYFSDQHGEPEPIWDTTRVPMDTLLLAVAHERYRLAKS